MTLPVPRLDDRSFQDIVDEAKGKLHRLAPDWSDHNVSDPGVALIELYAWMTEMMLYRMNQVPDRLYLKLLELLGILLHGSTAAGTDLLFRLTAPQPAPAPGCTSSCAYLREVELRVTTTKLRGAISSQAVGCRSGATVTLDRAEYLPPPQRFEPGTQPVSQAVALAAAR